MSLSEINEMLSYKQCKELIPFYNQSLEPILREQLETTYLDPKIDQIIQEGVNNYTRLNNENLDVHEFTVSMIVSNIRYYIKKSAPDTRDADIVGIYNDYWDKRIEHIESRLYYKLCLSASEEDNGVKKLKNLKITDYTSEFEKNEDTLFCTLFSKMVEELKNSKKIISYSDLADRSNLLPESIRDYRTGKSEPGFKPLYALCIAMGINDLNTVKKLFRSCSMHYLKAPTTSRLPCKTPVDREATNKWINIMLSIITDKSDDKITDVRIINALLEEGYYNDTDKKIILDQDVYYLGSKCR